MDNNAKIDEIISQLMNLKTDNKNTSKNVLKNVLKKWENCEDVKDVKKMTVKELRALCNHFEIEADGEKTMLANRLWENWEENASSESDTDDDDDYESE